MTRLKAIAMRTDTRTVTHRQLVRRLLFDMLLAATVLILLAPVAAHARTRHGIVDVPRPPVDHIVHLSDAQINDTCGAAACADPDTRTIYVTHDLGRFGVQHELGHLFDAELLSPHDHIVLMRRMGLRRGPWTRYDPVPGSTLLIERTGTGCTTWAPCPNELFADAYATCRLREVPGINSPTSWDTGYGWNPTPRGQRRFCRSVRAAAR